MGAKNRRRGFLGDQCSPCVHKGVLLSADERAKALRLKAQRFSAAAIARALGRPIPTVQAFLDSPEAKL